MTITPDGQRPMDSTISIAKPRVTTRTKCFTHGLPTGIYGDLSPFDLFKMQLVFGLVAFALQLPISITKDIRRRKEMKYGRRLKGPVLVTPKQFNKTVQGSGIGLKVDQCRRDVARSFACRGPALRDYRRHRKRQDDHHHADAQADSGTRAFGNSV